MKNEKEMKEKMEAVMPMNGFMELAENDLMMIDGGDGFGYVVELSGIIDMAIDFGHGLVDGFKDGLNAWN
jgi:hypothetical protein